MKVEFCLWVESWWWEEFEDLNIGEGTCHVRLDNKQMAEYVRNKIHSVGISDGEV